MWGIILADLKGILSKIEAEVISVWNFLTAYIHEAITEEEAALFPLIEGQAAQIMTDVVKTTGLTVKQRVALAETEIMAALVTDGKTAAATLVSAYVAVTAHKLGLINGNQGNLVGGVDSATNSTPVTPAA